MRCGEASSSRSSPSSRKSYSFAGRSPMAEQCTDVLCAADSQESAVKPSRKPALLREEEVLRKLLWNVREVAFIARVGVRTVWRMVADPESGFPRPRRLRGRTLFVRDE